jgi:hypothetical protein
MKERPKDVRRARPLVDQFSNVVKATLVFRDNLDATQTNSPHTLAAFLCLENVHDSDVSWIADRTTRGIEAELLDAAGTPVAPPPLAGSITSTPRYTFQIPFGSRLDLLITHGLGASAHHPPSSATGLVCARARARQTSEAGAHRNHPTPAPTRGLLRSGTRGRAHPGGSVRKRRKGLPTTKYNLGRTKGRKKPTRPARPARPGIHFVRAFWARFP